MRVIRRGREEERKKGKEKRSDGREKREGKIQG